MMFKKIINKFSSVNASIVLILAMVCAMFIHAQFESQQGETAAPYIEQHSDSGKAWSYESMEHSKDHLNYESREDYSLEVQE
jgi:hypothetical protein